MGRLPLGMSPGLLPCRRCYGGGPPFGRERREYPFPQSPLVSGYLLVRVAGRAYVVIILLDTLRN